MHTPIFKSLKKLIVLKNATFSSGMPGVPQCTSDNLTERSLGQQASWLQKQVDMSLNFDYITS